MHRDVYAHRLAPLTVSQLQEALTVCRLEWLRADSYGEDQHAAQYKELGQAIVMEHLRRGIDPESGKPLGMQSL